jgi:hypothetical protein
MPNQWPRALLRAELREQGYDALGTRGLAQAMVYPAAEAGRGPVRLLIVDDEVLAPGAEEMLGRLRRRHQDPEVMLLARGGRAPVEGPWRRVVQRPLAIEDIVRNVRDLLPLRASQRHPID